MREKLIGGVMVVEGTKAELDQWRRDQAARSEAERLELRERAELARAARKTMEDQTIEEARREADSR